MANKKFQRLSYSSVFQQIDKVIIPLTPNATTAVVADFDVTPISILTVTVAVTVAPLTAVEAWVRGDTNGNWFQLMPDQLYGYGRTDLSTDVTTTPAGVSFFLMLDCTGWSDVRIMAKSAGAAVLSITAGGQ